MARKLLCPSCDKEFSKLAKQFDELYESVEGKSTGEFICDSCASPNYIHKGDTCFAAVLLPDRNHFNYEIQKPENWLEDFMIPNN